MSSILSRFQPIFSLAALVLIFVCCVLAQIEFSQHSEAGYLWLGAAGILALILVKPLPWAGSPIRDAGTLDAARGLRLVLALVLILAGGALLIYTALLLHNELPGYSTPSPDAWSGYFIGLLLAGLGALCLVGIGRLPRPDLTMVLLVGVLAIAVFVRIYKLDSLPLGVWYDEADWARFARYMLDDPTYRPIFIPNQTFPNLIAYAISLQIYGLESIYGLRLYHALLASLGVITAYLFGRELRGGWFGLALAVIWAVMRWSINFSRIAMTGPEMVTFAFLTFYFALRFTRVGRLRDAFWFGVVLAFGAYSYRPYVLQLIPIGLYMLLEYPFRQRPWRRTLILSVVALVTAAAVLLPFIMFLVDRGPDYFDRMNRVSIFNENLPDVNEALLRSTVQHLEMFHLAGDRNGRHNLPGEPMLDPVTGSLFVIGLFVALRDKHRWKETLVFLVSIAVGLWGGIFSLSFEAPQALRSIGVLIGVMYFAAVALTGLFRAVAANLRALKFPSLLARGLAAAGAVAAIGIMAYWNFNIYFVKQSTSYDVWREYSTVDTLTARFFKQYDDDTQFFISPYIGQTPPLVFLADAESDRAQVLDMADPIPPPMSADSMAVFMLLPDEQPFVDDLRALYPNANVIPVRPADYGVDVSDDLILFTVIELTPADIASLQGLSDGSGVLYIPHDDTYTFDFAPGSVVEIDEMEIESGVPLQLVQGNHRITVAPADTVITWRSSWIAEEPIPDENLFHAPMTPNGLLASFYANADWQGEPVNQRIVPHMEHHIHILPMDRPYSVHYEGYLYVPQTGEYGFHLEAMDTGTFNIDGGTLLQVAPSGTNNESSVRLTRGWHEIELRHQDITSYTHIVLMWRPPGESGFIRIGRAYFCRTVTLCEIPGAE